MIVKIFSYLVIITTSITIYGLFTIKDKVASLHYQINAVTKQLDDESNMINILKAEQAYLRSPARLKKLSTLYLQLETVKISQMISDPLQPDKKKYAKYNGSTDPYFSKTKTKWRYKTIINDKYIKTISNKKGQ